MIKQDSIVIRDPFVLPCAKNDCYYMYGTTDLNPWIGDGRGFSYYRTKDFDDFEGPFTAFKASSDFWGTTQFWAPEVFEYKNKFYMMASFKPKNGCRGTGILISNSLDEVFTPLVNQPLTPHDWECLDGTFYVEDGKPYIVFSREWLEIKDGAFYIQELSEDLTATVGAPVKIFNASDAKWVRELRQGDPGMDEQVDGCYVTDGPYFYKCSDKTLAMIWSSFGSKGYAIGQSISSSGRVNGPWVHHSTPLCDEGGHGMIFKSLDQQLFLTFHSPNGDGYIRNEKMKLVRIRDVGNCIKII